MRLFNRLPKLAISTVAVSLVSAVALIVSTATPAQADVPLKLGDYGTVTFIDHGDKFKVCDRKADYWGVGTRYSYIRKNGSTQRGSHWNTSGAGTCRTFDHNFGEGRRVWFQVCIKDGPTILECGAVVETNA